MRRRRLPRVHVTRPDPVTGRWVREPLADQPMLTRDGVLHGLAVAALFAVLVLNLLVWGFVFPAGADELDDYQTRADQQRERNERIREDYERRAEAGRVQFERMEQEQHRQQERMERLRELD